MYHQPSLPGAFTDIHPLTRRNRILRIWPNRQASLVWYSSSSTTRLYDSIDNHTCNSSDISELLFGLRTGNHGGHVYPIFSVSLKWYDRFQIPWSVTVCRLPASSINQVLLYEILVRSSRWVFSLSDRSEHWKNVEIRALYGEIRPRLDGVTINPTNGNSTLLQRMHGRAITSP